MLFARGGLADAVAAYANPLFHRQGAWRFINPTRAKR